MEQIQEQFSVLIKAQYIKDLSFENPNSPASLFAGSAENPSNTDVKINVGSTKIDEEGHYESLISLVVESKVGDQAIYLMELHYAGLFHIEGIKSPEQLERILYIYCPEMLFPFARSIIANTILDGGFLPVMLAPVNFAALYEQNKNRKKEEAKSTSESKEI
jgi:preprotein translocase subunit SecB